MDPSEVKEVKVQSLYRYSSNGHLMETQFPSLESLQYYLDEFQRAFPDTYSSDLKIYRLDVFELQTKNSN